MDKQQIEIRRLEPEDYRAIQQIHSQPRAIWGTLQMPFPSAEVWKKRLAEQLDERISLAACVDGTVVGSLGLSPVTRAPRRRHVGELGMAVHDDWQGRGIGTVLMRAAQSAGARKENFEAVLYRADCDESLSELNACHVDSYQPAE